MFLTEYPWTSGPPMIMKTLHHNARPLSRDCEGAVTISGVPAGFSTERHVPPPNSLSSTSMPATQTSKAECAAPRPGALRSLCLRVLALSKYFYFYEVDEKSPVLTDGFLIDRVIVSCIRTYYKGNIGSKTGRIRRDPSRNPA